MVPVIAPSRLLPSCPAAGPARPSPVTAAPKSAPFGSPTSWPHSGRTPKLPPQVQERCDRQCELPLADMLDIHT